MSKKFPKIESLAVKIPLLFAFMLFIMMAVFLVIMQQYGNRVLLDMAKQQVRQSGELMVSVLGQRLSIAGTIVSAVADAAESLPANDKIHHQVIKRMIDHDNTDHFIAGGGIWPEPYLYTKKKALRSFFWGRNEQNTLQYFDDYNDPNGNGYHNEEWYAPSRLLNQTQLYWSRSYMDPYSLESMVTVTAPMYKNDKFYGAATLDLTLDGLEKLLTKESEKFGGYAYILDRNGTFISYPDVTVSKKDVVTEDGKTVTQFTNISEAVKAKHILHDVTATLLKSENVSQLNKEMNDKALALSSDSYQINTYEAHRIISTIEDPLKQKGYGSTFIKEFNSDFDALLEVPVFINVFHVPNAYWKVITVTPIETVNHTSESITRAVMIGFILVIALGLLLGLIAIQLILINPIKRMKFQISDQGGRVITGINTGELGDLANRFNENNLALRTANIELEESVVKAEQATIAKAQFLANMSHEIRTPMNGVNGMLNLLQDSDLTEQQRHYTQIATSSADSLLVLINDILDFSKIESGKMNIESTEFNIRDALSDFFPTMEHLADLKGLELILDLSGLEAGWVKSDLGRIRQILTNLISNAIKFTTTGYVLVKISIKDVNDMGFILYGSVTDTGIGVKKEKIKSLFDSFSQVDASTTRKYGGTGLGLAICKQLCELLDGSISAKSEVGEGSRFEFTLRLDRPEKKPTFKKDDPLNGKQILIFDKTDKKGNGLSDFLLERGASVVSHSTVSDVVTSLKSTFDYIFVDIKQVNTNYKTRQELKDIAAECERNDTQIVGLTTVISSQYDEYYLNLGCNKVILLPVTDNAIQLMMMQTTKKAALKKTSVSQQTSAETTPEYVSLKGAKVLLVEDNMINQEVALGLLREMDVIPDIVNNGLEAMNVIVNNLNSIEYDIVLMDCQMPVMDGYEATRQIRLHELERNMPRVPIIAMTANAMKGDKEKCFEAGMDDYVSKPINVPLLNEKLIKWYK